MWFIAAFPAILAMAGAVRLVNIICKMQLAHACLGQACLLTGPTDSSYLDFVLLTMLNLSQHSSSGHVIWWVFGFSELACLPNLAWRKRSVWRSMFFSTEC